MLSSWHTIEFLNKYFASNVHFNEQYQFLFVSKYMQVLGSSSYFYFVPVKGTGPVVKEILKLKQPQGVQVPEVFVMIPRPCASSVTLSAAQQRQAQLQKLHYLGKLNNTWIEENINEAEQYKEEQHWRKVTQGGKQIKLIQPCPHCRQPKNALRISENLVTQVRATAEHARVLETKLQKVEHALEMSQVSRKALQLAAHHAKREKVAYQKFVNDLLISLSEKGTARIILGEGREMLLKKVTNEREETFPKKASPLDPYLKAIIGSQEQTIRNLQEQLKYTHHLHPSEAEHEANIHPSKKEMLGLDINWNVTSNDDTKTHLLNKTFTMDESVTMRDKQQQLLQELTQVLAERKLHYDDQPDCDWWNENEELEPTTVVIEGGHAKFAIMRMSPDSVDVQM